MQSKLAILPGIQVGRWLCGLLAVSKRRCLISLGYFMAVYTETAAFTIGRIGVSAKTRTIAVVQAHALFRDKLANARRDDFIPKQESQSISHRGRVRSRMVDFERPLFQEIARGLQ